MLKLVIGKRARQEKWEAALVWFRLRYLEAAALKQCLTLLSQKEACGRIALYYQPGSPVSELYLGIPESCTRLCCQIAADFSLSLKPKSSEVPIPKAGRFIAASLLPWDKPFIAHISEAYLFIYLTTREEKREGRFFPHPPTAKQRENAPNWELPQPPPTGLTLEAPWNTFPTVMPDRFAHVESMSQCWPIGRTVEGRMLHMSGHLNLYGRQDSVAAWLVNQVTQRVSDNPRRLVVLDGFGDLVPQLKRKAAITRLMGEKLTYLDIDSASVTSGFNPLAAVPGEGEAARLLRWQRWFTGMQVHPLALKLLSQAREDGIEDIPAMIKWLKRAERQEQNTGVASLKTALERLTGSRTLREWLEWPTNPLEILPDGVLLFACKASDWARQQVLAAVCYSVMQLEDTCLVIHGFNWGELHEKFSPKSANVVLSNGPILPGGTVILTESHAQGVTILAKRFLSGDVLWRENLELLHRGEGIIVSEGAQIWTSWNKEHGRQAS